MCAFREILTVNLDKVALMISEPVLLVTRDRKGKTTTDLAGNSSKLVVLLAYCVYSTGLVSQRKRRNSQ